MTGGPRRVALYTRISTDEANQPYSLGAQRDRLEAFVASQPGWKITARYEDQASGKSLERAALTTARREAQSGLFDLLLVFRVDRLSRNLGQLAALIEELEQAEVGFQSLSEPFDTSTPAGRMMLQMLGVFAEFERASIIERIGAGMERKARRGEWTVGSYPFGYRRDPATPGLTPDPAAAQVVRDIFERYVTHRQGSGAIADWLNARGLRTSRGGLWTRSSVLKLLANRVYEWSEIDLELASALLGVSLSAILSRELPPARSKALLGQLIEEVRVVSGADVRVTYRVPPEVRLPDGMVEMRGLEPLTPAMRTQCSPS